MKYNQPSPLRLGTLTRMWGEEGGREGTEYGGREREGRQRREKGEVWMKIRKKVRKGKGERSGKEKSKKDGVKEEVK